MERPHIFKHNPLAIPSTTKPTFTSEMIEMNLTASSHQPIPQHNTEEKSFEFNVQTCADLITFYLTELGFNTVFGVPGGNIDPLFASMNTLHELNFLEIINPLHEAAGIFMADGFYRETGKLSLVCATSGPGATNLITGVVSAYEQHIPMLIITAQPPISDLGRHAWQEMSCTTSNIVNMMKECCRYSTLVSHPEQLEYKLLTSLAYALGPSGGPVHLSIPRDILKTSIKLKFSKRRDIIDSIQKKYFPLDAIMFHELYSKIQSSKSGTFVLGERAGGAVYYAEKLARILGWSIVTTPAAKGLIDYRHPNFLGVVGMAGHAQAIAALRAEQSELLIAFGMTFNEMTTLSWNESNLFSQRLISIESNPDIQAQFFNAQLQILSNPAMVLRALYERLSSPSAPSISHNTTPQNSIWISEQKPYQKIHPGALMEYLSEAAPLDCRLGVDIGNSMLWAVQAWRFRRSLPVEDHKNHFYFSLNFAAMGSGLSGIIGMALGNRDGRHICLVGDGAVLMSSQQIIISHQLNLNINYFIFNDSAYGMIEHGRALTQTSVKKGQAGLPKVDFVMMSKSMGIEAYPVETWQDLINLNVGDLLDAPGTRVFDIHIDPTISPPLQGRFKVPEGPTH